VVVLRELGPSRLAYAGERRSKDCRKSFDMSALGFGVVGADFSKDAELWSSGRRSIDTDPVFTGGVSAVVTRGGYGEDMLYSVQDRDRRG